MGVVLVIVMVVMVHPRGRAHAQQHYGYQAKGHGVDGFTNQCLRIVFINTPFGMIKD
jgi:hypothetical protein